LSTMSTIAPAGDREQEHRQAVVHPGRAESRERRRVQARHQPTASGGIHPPPMFETSVAVQMTRKHLWRKGDHVGPTGLVALSVTIDAIILHLDLGRATDADELINCVRPMGHRDGRKREHCGKELRRWLAPSVATTSSDSDKILLPRAL